jgi:hypothetical protein
MPKPEKNEERELKPPVEIPAPEPTAAAGVPVDDSVWAKFLATLQDVRLTTFALVAQNVHLERQESSVTLVFEPQARQAYHFAQKAEHLSALNETAGKAVAAEASVRLMVAGEPATLVPQVEQVSPESPEDLPDEIRHDILDKSSEIGQPATVDPSKLQAAAEEIESGLKSKQQAAGPPSAQEAISLFDATELDPEED